MKRKFISTACHYKELLTLTGGKFLEKQLIIYTHPPPFNEISPSGEMGRLTQKIFIITELIL